MFLGKLANFPAAMILNPKGERRVKDIDEIQELTSYLQKEVAICHITKEKIHKASNLGK